MIVTTTLQTKRRKTRSNDTLEPRLDPLTVRAEPITEAILERTGQLIFNTHLLE